MSEIEKGDYVLATKYSDGDPLDHWGLGFYDGEDERKGRFFVVDSKGRQLRPVGFRRVKRITAIRGHWIWENRKFIESGDRSLWFWARMKQEKLSELEKQSIVMGFR